MLSPLLVTLVLLPAEAPANALPAEWYGRWTGTLKITPVDGKQHETPMEMVVEPIKDSKDYRWRIVYGEGTKKQVREYELKPQEKANHFIIDEKNGLLIDAFLVGTSMHSSFQVADSLIPVRYERTGDVLRFSLTVYSTKDVRTTKMEKGDVETKAHKLLAVHTAELRKPKAD